MSARRPGGAANRLRHGTDDISAAGTAFDVSLRDQAAYASLTVERDTRRSAATLRVAANRSPEPKLPLDDRSPQLLIQLHAHRPRIARIKEQLHEQNTILVWSQVTGLWRFSPLHSTPILGVGCCLSVLEEIADDLRGGGDANGGRV